MASAARKPSSCLHNLLLRPKSSFIIQIVLSWWAIPLYWWSYPYEKNFENWKSSHQRQFQLKFNWFNGLLYLDWKVAYNEFSCILSFQMDVNGVLSWFNPTAFLLAVVNMHCLFRLVFEMFMICLMHLLFLVIKKCTVRDMHPSMWLFSLYLFLTWMISWWRDGQLGS